MKSVRRQNFVMSGAVVVVFSSLFVLMFLQKNIPAKQEKEPAHVAGVSTTTCPYKIVSWNIANLGTSKTEEDISMMADTLQGADIVAIQEVTAGKDRGALAVARIASELSKRTKYDYIVSNPTEPKSPSVERYAYILKSSILFSRDDAHLVKELQESVEREPYHLSVKLDGISLNLFNFHAVPTAKNPAKEVAELPTSTLIAKASPSIFVGDFNLPGHVTDGVFGGIGYAGNIREKTSLKQKLDQNGGYLLHQYDNIYTKGVRVCSSGVIDFVSKVSSPVTNETLERARKVSDHLPVFATFGF